MKRFSLSELNRRSGELADEAVEAPLVLMKRARPYVVMMSVRDYERLIGKTLAQLENAPVKARGRREFAGLPASED